MKKLVLWTGLGLGFIGISALIFLLFWIYNDSELFHWFTKIDSGKASDIGQFIGGFVGVFLSGAGVLLIYSTFQEQKEFNKKTNTLSDKQQFETTFFNLINTYRTIVNSTKETFSIKNTKEMKYE